MRLLLILLFMLKSASALRYPSSSWIRDWNIIKKMRSQTLAPVDSMGAESLADKTSADFGTPSFRFRTLIATMLSPQTKDKQTSIALTNIQTMLCPHPFLPSVLMNHTNEEVFKCISGVSFAKTKTENILKAAQTCVEVYQDDIPPSIDELLRLRGVGPKIAFLTFSIAYNQHLGIVVDTHVHRISNRLAWVDSNTPEQSRKQLEELIPNQYWEEVNNVLVGFGQTICKARAPKCSTCLLNSTCKYFNETQNKEMSL